jgi:hypothetical protein
MPENGLKFPYSLSKTGPLMRIIRHHQSNHCLLACNIQNDEVTAVISMQRPQKMLWRVFHEYSEFSERNFCITPFDNAKYLSNIHTCE